MIKIHVGDCRKVLQTLPAKSVDCVVTSPPYYGLRDYGTAEWEGGAEECGHVVGELRLGKGLRKSAANTRGGALKVSDVPPITAHTQCGKCGAIRNDSQIGLEQTPEEYIAAMVLVFDEVRRVLRDDGTLWLNLGDSYYNYRPGRGQALVKQSVAATNQDLPQSCARRGNKLAGLKEKDLIGIPWRAALALQAAGWYLRQDIIWHKPNPMPESVTDRCTKAHEYIFLLSKSPRYYFDQESVKRPVKQDWGERDRANGKYHNEGTGLQPHSGLEVAYEKANIRSVWEVATAPFDGAHFATFPPALIEPCIKAGTPEGGMVLDPFFGAGTTGLVADRLGRDCIGIELNPEYARIAANRLNDDAGMFSKVEVIENAGNRSAVLA